jgi:nitrogen fixation protein FixH
MKTRVNLWPIGILALLLLGVGLTLWTLDAAANNKVQLENSYMANYHDVDETFNDIMAKKVKFEKNFILDLEEVNLKLGENNLNVKLFSKDITPVKNAKITALITRPHTVESDIKIETFKYSQDGEYESSNFKLEQKGRWEVILKVQVDDYETFEKLKFKNI